MKQVGVKRGNFKSTKNPTDQSILIIFASRKGQNGHFYQTPTFPV